MLGSSSSSTAIGSSNIGFQLLKKHGWKEGTGIGVSEQGILEPLQACVNHNKRGLGSIYAAKTTNSNGIDSTPKEKNDKEEAMGEKLVSSSSSKIAIDSSNIGFQLLKKHGWKEGSGLGISEQGIVEPVEAYLKHNKRGLGAEKARKKIPMSLKSPASAETGRKEHPPSKQSKRISKKLLKMLEFEKRLQEKEFEQAFYREFWPDNV